MTTATAYPPPIPRLTPRARFPYATIFALLAATLVIGTTAYFSLSAAAVIYVPFYLVFCWYRPYAALALMFGEVAFPFNVNSTGLANTALAEISLCLAFPVFWLRAMSESRRGVPNPMAIPLWTYFVICIISSFVHWTGQDAIVTMGQMAVYLVLAVWFFSSFITDRRQIFGAMYGLIAATTFMAIVILALRREYVLGVHKNATGGFLSYTVIMLTELWLLAASAGRRKGWLNLLLAINVGGLVMSTSRGAWLGAAAGISVMMVARRQYGLFLRGACVMIPAIMICWLYLPQEQRQYAFAFSGDMKNIKARMDNYAFFADQFSQSPVIGMGVGLRKERDSTNIIMSTLAETGVLGLLAFLSIQAAFFWTVFRAMRRVPRDDPDFSILVLGAALVLCLFTHGQVDHYWSRTQLPVWGLAGAAIAVAHTRKMNSVRRI